MIPTINLVLYYGRNRVCPVCGHSFRRFLAYGVNPRKDAKCPYCGALERHRLLWLFLSRETDLLDGRPKRVLHFAPEPCFSPMFTQLFGDGYLTADLSGEGVKAKIDVTDIPCPDGSFDVVICSHVLEHVMDDRTAMRELYRVLKPGGRAIVNVPISPATIEDPTVTDPVERARLYGQADHVRRYGEPEFVSRLQSAGFRVRCVRTDDLVGPEDRDRMWPIGHVFYCEK